MQFLSNVMLEALRFFAYFGGYGWGIVWLTIAVNLALYPLTLSSIKSMAAMQRIQPKMQELQKKLKEKPQELQKASMDLYRSEGVNPFGGCLPVLLKIPFFLALFWSLQSTEFLGIASNPENNTRFGWISGRVSGGAFQSDILVRKLEEAKIIVLDKKASQGAGESQYVWNAILKIKGKTLKDLLHAGKTEGAKGAEKIKSELGDVAKGISAEEVSRVVVAWGETNSLATPDRIGTPVGKVSLLALLIGITTYLMQITMPGAASQQTQVMTMFMPFFIVFVCWSFPAGVNIYWLVSNVVGALQQYYILKMPGHLPRKKGGTKP